MIFAFEVELFTDRNESQVRTIEVHARTRSEAIGQVWKALEASPDIVVLVEKGVEK